MHRSILLLGAILLGAAALPAPAWAEVVELTDGALFAGTVTRESGVVRVRTAGGSVLEFEESRVREVRPGGWREEYLRRREACPAGSADGRYRLALWCGSKGLADEQETELAAALAVNPEHRAALEKRAALAAARAAVVAPAAAPPAQKGSDGLFRHDTEHVRAAADGAAELARGIADIAEADVSDFAEVFEVPADSPEMKRFRVRVRYYADKEDYDRARRAAGAGGASGFFDPMAGMCHIAPAGKDGRIGFATRQTVRHEVGHALAMRVLGVTAHRTWLAETLATAMEGSDADGLGGGLVWTRLPFLARASDRSGLTVEKLLATGSGGDVSLDDYARIWSFAHFIFYGDDARERARLLAPRRRPDPEALAKLGRTRKEDFLAMLAEVRAGGFRADVEGLFRKHFPDREALEAAWQAHVKALIETRLAPAVRVQVLVSAPGTAQ